MAQLEGAYSVVALAEGKLVAFRDPHGFRPLCVGRLDGGWVGAWGAWSCASGGGGRVGVVRARPGGRGVRARRRARRAGGDRRGRAPRTPSRHARGRRLTLHLRVLLSRAPGLASGWRRGACGARADGRAARRGGRRRGGPRAGGTRLGDAPRRGAG